MCKWVCDSVFSLSLSSIVMVAMSGLVVTRSVVEFSCSVNSRRTLLLSSIGLTGKQSLVIEGVSVKLMDPPTKSAQAVCDQLRISYNFALLWKFVTLRTK